MTTPDELLRDHPLYGLDRVIADYLGLCLERQFGAPLRRWHILEEAQTAAATNATLQLAPTLVGRPLKLQEDILPGAVPDPELERAWRSLLALARGEWRDLCLLYEQVLSELRDLYCMAVAQRAAEESGNAAHAALVRRVLALDKTFAPVWLPIG